MSQSCPARLSSKRSEKPAPRAFSFDVFDTSTFSEKIDKLIDRVTKPVSAWRDFFETGQCVFYAKMVSMKIEPCETCEKCEKLHLVVKVVLQLDGKLKNIQAGTSKNIDLVFSLKDLAFSSIASVELNAYVKKVSEAFIVQLKTIFQLPLLQQIRQSLCEQYRANGSHGQYEERAKAAKKAIRNYFFSLYSGPPSQAKEVRREGENLNLSPL